MAIQDPLVRLQTTIHLKIVIYISFIQNVIVSITPQIFSSSHYLFKHRFDVLFMLINIGKKKDTSLKKVSFGRSVGLVKK